MSWTSWVWLKGDWKKVAVRTTIGEAARESLKTYPRLPSRCRALTQGSRPDWVPRDD